MPEGYRREFYDGLSALAGLIGRGGTARRNPLAAGQNRWSPGRRGLPYRGVIEGLGWCLGRVGSSAACGMRASIALGGLAGRWRSRQGLRNFVLESAL